MHRFAFIAWKQRGCPHASLSDGGEEKQGHGRDIAGNNEKGIKADTDKTPLRAIDQTGNGRSRQNDRH